MVFIKWFFSFFSAVAPIFAANQAFRFFQKVRKKDIRDRERPFYQMAARIQVPERPEILAYQSGNLNGPLVIMIHGWDSNPGSLSFIESKLGDLGYKIISFTLPAHGYSKASHTNMFEAKVAFQTLIEHIDPTEPFDAVTHSFGSGVLVYGMSELNYKLNRVVLLTSPNLIIDIFNDYKKMINLGDKAFSHMCSLTNEVLGEDINKLSMKVKLQGVDYQRIKIIHDKKDQIIPYENAIALSDNNSKIHLDSYENIGHYRMLWNEEVLDSITEFLTLDT